MERTIGVFGEELLLWVCVLRQSPTRPPAEHVHRQANLLLDELKGSKLAQGLAVDAVDDGMFAAAALVDEVAMSLADLRPLWASHPLQATRWMTNNAGAEFFTRLERVRKPETPKSVLATYVTVLGLGFLGKYGVPGADRGALAQLRRELHIQMGIDVDRDWDGGVLRASRKEEAARVASQEKWWRSPWVGRVLAALLMLTGLGALVAILVRNLT